jgi:tRNA 2-thiouridine synthesizing protein A
VTHPDDKPAASGLTADAALDARGLRCPEPLMLARNRLREMRGGEILHIQATDPSTERDFRNLCRFMGHALLDFRVAGGELEFWIRKA